MSDGNKELTTEQTGRGSALACCHLASMLGISSQTSVVQPTNNPSSISQQRTHEFMRHFLVLSGF